MLWKQMTSGAVGAQGQSWFKGGFLEELVSRLKLKG